MIREEDVYKIGTFNKPHGIHGELQFTFTDDIFDRVDADYVVCPMEGILVPFFIEEYRFKGNASALMKLENVDSVEQAKKFTNTDVYFPRDLREDEAYEMRWDDFIGYTIEDKVHGPLGEITYVDNSTQNTLFYVDYQGEELLIPAQEDFILDLNVEKKHILMQLPQGLVHSDESLSDED